LTSASVTVARAFLIGGLVFFFLLCFVVVVIYVNRADPFSSSSSSSSSSRQHTACPFSARVVALRLFPAMMTRRRAPGALMIAPLKNACFVCLFVGAFSQPLARSLTRPGVTTSGCTSVTMCERLDLENEGGGGVKGRKSTCREMTLLSGKALKVQRCRSDRCTDPHHHHRWLLAPRVAMCCVERSSDERKVGDTNTGKLLRNV